MQKYNFTAQNSVKYLSWINNFTYIFQFSSRTAVFQSYLSQEVTDVSNYYEKSVANVRANCLKQRRLIEMFLDLFLRLLDALDVAILHGRARYSHFSIHLQSWEVKLLI